MWLKFIEDYRYFKIGIIFQKGTSEFVNDIEFAEYLIDNGYAEKENINRNYA